MSISKISEWKYYQGKGGENRLKYSKQHFLNQFQISFRGKDSPVFKTKEDFTYGS